MSPYKSKLILTGCCALILVGITFFTSCAQSITFENIPPKECANIKHPLLTKTDAICHAVSIEQIVTSLHRAQELAKKQEIYIKWNAKAEITREGIWIVEIKSKGMLPSYGCKLSFDKDGKLINIQGKEDISCRYNK